jgi:putative tryptophan/tyrosine transport system substrate-binding protein
MIGRREFITLLGGAAAAWPLAARAQPSERVRRIGVFTNLAADDPESQARIGAFLQGLQQSGWTIGSNVRIDYRWGTTDYALYHQHAVELVALGPDVLLCVAGAALTSLQQATRSVPIVFVGAIDPVGAGQVASLARPGGNATGFALFEYALSSKWLELLKQLAPAVTCAAVLRDSGTAGGIGQFAALQSVAPSLNTTLTALDVRDAGEIERAVTAFGREPNGGLIVPLSGLAIRHRDLIVTLAAQQRLPAVYSYRPFISAGGLVSYGPDIVDQYRRAAGYVDRILRGEKAADLPVQAPTKFELVINVKAARALDLTVPHTVLATADEVIE